MERASESVPDLEAKVAEAARVQEIEEKIVAALKISARTVRRDWDFAKAWLLRELSHRTEKPTAHDPRALPAN